MFNRLKGYKELKDDGSFEIDEELKKILNKKKEKTKKELENHQKEKEKLQDSKK